MPSRARSTMRASMSVPVIATSRAGRPSGRRRRACRPRRRRSSRRSRRGSGPPARARAGRRGRATSHCSGLRQSCETLIVTRSRKRVELVAVAAQHARGTRAARRGRASWRTSGCGAPSGRACTGGGRSGRGAGRPRRSRRTRRCGVWARALNAPASRDDRGGQLVERRGRRRRGRPRRPRAACRRRCRSTRPRTRTRPPWARTASAPSRPSLPMPVSTTSSRRRPKSFAASSMREVGARAQAADRLRVGEHDAALGVEAQVRPPGARSDLSGSSVSPPAASTTWSGEARSSRAASDAVKPAGMCWTIRVPAPRRRAAAGRGRRARAGRRSRRR